MSLWGWSRCGCIGTRLAPWSRFWLYITFSIFFGGTRTRSALRFLILILRSASRARTGAPIGLGLRFALWSRLPAFWPRTWSTFAPRPRTEQESQILYQHLARTSTPQSAEKDPTLFTGSDFLRYFAIYCGCSCDSYFVTFF